LRIKTLFNRGAYENLINAKKLEEEEALEIEDTEDEIVGVCFFYCISQVSAT
jgi:hypothetical protein